MRGIPEFSSVRWCASLVALLSAGSLPAQAVHDHAAATDSSAPGTFDWRGVRGNIGFMAAGLVTRVSPAWGGKDFTEGYLTQPNLMAGATWRVLTFTGTLNAERYTLDRGELTPGIYGEGYVDRRHPHTVLHELMVSLAFPGADADGLSASLSVGKGFAPYGTDDPMMRPLVKYPVNHHHAQILERAQVTGAVRYARNGADITIETGVFNGDEPTSPGTNPSLSRVGDSRAARLTVRPRRQVELQVSGAYITSPDIIQGGASDHKLRSASARWEGRLRGTTGSYALVEFERNREVIDGRDQWLYESALGEVMASWQHFSLAARWERTDRPEHERLLDPFRTHVGHISFQLLGITRWETATVHLGGPGLTLPRAIGSARLTPFVEVARATPSAVVTPTVFEPAPFYGAASLWSYSIGVRVHVGTMRSRMGRYGVALPRATQPSPAHH